ncbi:MAG: OmpH family outer membrane protein [Planctomycetes bacterium]|nr:OmpH family outer membrane protein [Planctomycetota bacterium]
MFLTTRWSCAAVALAVCLAGLLVCRTACGKDRAPKIGVVNVTKVYDNYKKKRDMENDLRAQREQKSRVIHEKEKEIKRLTDEIKLLELGSDARKKREADLEKRQVDLQSFTRVTVGNMATRTREIMQRLYTEVVEAVQKYGRQNGFDLIIKWENVEVESKTMDELLYKINQRTVLFASDHVDITDEVISALNAGYSKEIIEK